MRPQEIETARETAKQWRIRPESAFADFADALQSAWNRYAFERSNDAYAEVAKLIEFGTTVAGAGRPERG